MRILGCFLAAVCAAQVSTGPVVQPRGVVNADTQRPAPSQVAPGGVVEIRGLSLSAPVEVFVNERPARILSAAADRILAQVPLETPPGLANVVVRKGELSSRPARVQIVQVVPALASANGLGFGPPALQVTDGATQLRATGLGPIREDGTPQQEVRLLVDGLERPVTVRSREEAPGIFDITLGGEAIPAGVPILLTANNAAANPLVQGPASASAELLFVPLPPGTPELRSLRSSDVRGTFLVASAARRPDGCYPSFLLDAELKSVVTVPGCPTIAQPAQLSPFVDVVNSAAFGALDGPYSPPPAGQAPAAFAKRVHVLHATRPPVFVEVPDPVLNLASAGSATLAAVSPQAPGQPAKVFEIDVSSTEVTERSQGPMAGAGAQNVLARLQNLDLGDGLTELLAAPGLAGNQIIVAVGDSLTSPKRAKVALLNPQIEVVAQRDFPDGWLPIVAPAAPPAANPPGNPAPPAGANAQRLPSPAFFDGPTRTYYIAVRNGQGRHALAGFPVEGEARLFEVPGDWAITACIPVIPVFNIELSRRLALMASRAEDLSFKNPCPADGYALFDLAARQLRMVPLPGAGQLNASGGANEINDFLFGNNTDPARRNTADTLFVLDAVNENSFRFDLPAGVNNFSGGASVAAMNLIAALANNRAPGDAGLVLFDLESAEAKLLPTPEGFAAINLIGVVPAVRKVVARGVLGNNAGSQFLVYDLQSGDLQIVKNPEGVVWVGPAPATPPTPGQAPQPAAQIPVRFNPKANSVEAIALGEDRRQVGVLVLKLK